jgi:hypothetical protein
MFFSRVHSLISRSDNSPAFLFQRICSQTGASCRGIALALTDVDGIQKTEATPATSVTNFGGFSNGVGRQDELKLVMEKKELGDGKMIHSREWFNFIFLALLLGSYALLALFAFARALAGLVRHRHNDVGALTGEGEQVMANDALSAITMSHEAISFYDSRRRQSVISR